MLSTNNFVFMTPSLLFVGALFPPLILLGLFIWSRRRPYFLRTLILGATFVHELLLVSFPTIYSIFTDYKLEDGMFALVRAEDLLRVLIGESLFMLMFAFSFLIALPRFRTHSLSLISTNISERTEKNLMNILILIGCLVYIPPLLAPSTIGEKYSGLSVDQFIYWLKSIFWYTPLVACAFIFTKKNNIVTKPVFTLLATLPLLSLFLIGISMGVRGRLIWGISLLIIAGIYNHQKKIIAISLAIAILVIPVFSVLGNSEIRNYAGDTSQAEIIGKVYQAGKDNLIAYEELGDIFLSSFALRAQGVRNSVTLYQNFDQGGGGFTTYLGSILLPIPRFIWDEKPMSGSLDHTELESAMYKVMELSYDATGQMGPMLASAHAYWEGGWFWLIFAGLITGLLWNIIFRICINLPDNIAAIFALTFAASNMVDGLLTMMVPLYSVINAFWLSILPLFFLYKLSLVFNFYRLNLKERESS